MIITLEAVILPPSEFANRISIIPAEVSLLATHAYSVVQPSVHAEARHSSSGQDSEKHNRNLHVSDKIICSTILSDKLERRSMFLSDDAISLS